MNKILLIILLLFGYNTVVSANMVKIAVIDTGFAHTQTSNLPFCMDGHYDFEKNEAKIGNDDHGHGTNIALTINNQIETQNNHCFVIYKIPFGKREINLVPLLIKAINKAVNNQVNFINYSISGLTYIQSEFNAFQRAVNSNIQVFVSVGNLRLNLNKKCKAFPACYKLKFHKNFYVISAKNFKFANYGNIVDKYYQACTNFYIKKCGTSQATAIATGKAVNYVLNK